MDGEEMTDYELVVLWQQADSLASFCKITGMDKGNARNWAACMRRNEVSLKKFCSGPPRGYQRPKNRNYKHLAEVARVSKRL